MGEILKAVKKTSTTTSTVMREEKKERPKASQIREQTVRTETEQIENGFLVTKNYEGTYWKDKEKSDYSWFNYSKKWYSEDDPITVTVNDKSLADAFEED